MSRSLVVVDTETTGLDVTRHWALEVAAVNLATGEELYFVPAPPAGALDGADPKAMQINRYFERGVWKEALTGERAALKWKELWGWLDGNVLAAVNPTFDALMLVRSAKAHWPASAMRDLRLVDLSTYAAGRLDLPPNELPGTKAVFERLGVVNEDPHSALGDARATAECFRRLIVNTGAQPDADPGLADLWNVAQKISENASSVARGSLPLFEQGEM